MFFLSFFFSCILLTFLFLFSASVVLIVYTPWSNDGTFCLYQLAWLPNSKGKQNNTIRIAVIKCRCFLDFDDLNDKKNPFSQFYELFDNYQLLSEPILVFWLLLVAILIEALISLFLVW